MSNKSSEKPLSKAAIKFLRGIAHNIKPIVTISDKGLTENVLNEIEIAINHHEILKIKIRADRDTRSLLQEQILKQSRAHLIQSIGQTLTIFRINHKDPVYELPKK
ncbi:MAG: YhbY family RNA-binding protein [Proteobacteria bacterium]|nr:YhbY family RNA-binding protein [Pseudomonadota bacterium]